MTQAASLPAGSLSAPIWKSPFRPFYLLGAIYCPLLMLLWIASYSGLIEGVSPGYSLSMWHGHEMIFGFFGAIVAGFVLTALGSWAQTEEISGWQLMVLSILWILGRVAVYASSYLPAPLVLLVDSSLYFVMSLMITPRLWAAPNKAYLSVLIIFGGLCLGNVLFHLGMINSDAELASLGLRTGAYAIMIKMVVAGAFLAVVFTNNVLSDKKVNEIRSNATIEILTVLSLAAFIVSDLFQWDAEWRGVFAIAAALIHSIRWLRWKTRHITNYPIILIMHLAYLWLIAAFVFRAIHDLSGNLPVHLWLHVFTVGALGLMGISFMTRVALRHTGRNLKVPPIIILCYGLIFLAALLRVWAYLFSFDMQLMITSAVLWTIPFIVYLVLYGRFLWQPSLAKKKASRIG